MFHNDHIIFIAIIILYILLSYLFYKRYTRQRDSFNVNQIKKSIDKVGTLGSEIANLGNKLGSEISKIGKLGDKISNMGDQIVKVSKYPAELGLMLEKEITKVAKKASNQITKTANKAFDEIESAANEVGDFAEGSINTIWGSLNEMGEVIEDIPNQVATLAESIFLDWIPMVFKEAWKFFKKYFIDPLVGIFGEVGEIFGVIGDVFEEIFKTFMKIPSCVPVYMADATYTGILWGLDSIVPAYIKDLVKMLHENITKPFIIPVFNMLFQAIKFCIQFLGFNLNFNYFSDYKKKCYNFGPLGKIIKMFGELFKIVFDGIKKIFEIIPIDMIIKEIMKLFGASSGNNNNGSNTVVSNTVNNTINTSTNAVSNTIDTVDNVVKTSMDTTNDVLTKYGIPSIPDITKIPEVSIRDLNMPIQLF